MIRGETTGAWLDLIDEIEAMQRWYLPDQGSVSAYIGVDAGGDFFGGAHVDGEVLGGEEDGYGLDATGDSPAECIADLIQKMREYREREDPKGTFG